jgi:hypothetical protein
VHIGVLPVPAGCATRRAPRGIGVIEWVVVAGGLERQAHV